MKPFLAKFATPRTEDYELPGGYSRKRSMWEVDSSSGPIPLIRSSLPLSELETKTKMKREDDDLPRALAEFSTKTDVRREAEDASPYLLEGLTKTAMPRERDDQEWVRELFTKTEQAPREKDEQ